jgi:hypothetical protein
VVELMAKGRPPAAAAIPLQVSLLGRDGTAVTDNAQ